MKQYHGDVHCHTNNFFFRMFRALRNEFRWSNFGFDYPYPEDFATFAWQSRTDKVSGYLIIYRWIAASLFLSILVANGATSTAPAYWFIYLTHLGFIMQTLHLVVSFAVSVQQILSSNKGGITWLNKISWFLYNASSLVCLIITVIYWSVLFNARNGLEAMNFFVHGFNSIMSVFDIFASRRPCRLLHFYHPFVIMLAYVAFTAIYWAAGGRTDQGLSYIYPVTNWENLKLTVPFVIVGLFVVLPLVHSLLWLLHQLRDFCFRSFRVNDFPSEPSEAVSEVVVVPRVVISHKSQGSLQGQLNEAFTDDVL